MNSQVKYELNRLMKIMEEVQIENAHKMSCQVTTEHECSTIYDGERDLQPSTNHPYSDERELP